MINTELIQKNLPICTHLTSIENIQKFMSDKKIQEVIIVDSLEEKHILGTVHNYTINTHAYNKGVDPHSLSVEECLYPLLYSMDINSSLEECEQYLKENNIDEVALVDNNPLCGIFNSLTYHQENPETSDI